MDEVRDVEPFSGGGEALTACQAPCQLFVAGRPSTAAATDMALRRQLVSGGTTVYIRKKRALRRPKDTGATQHKYSMNRPASYSTQDRRDVLVVQLGGVNSSPRAWSLSGDRAPP